VFTRNNSVLRETPQNFTWVVDKCLQDIIQYWETTTELYNIAVKWSDNAAKILQAIPEHFQLF
jgi:hypothetical protein